MIYFKSICVGLAFVLGFVCVTLLLGELVLDTTTRLLRREETSFYVVLHFHHFWLPCLLLFVAGFIWEYRHLSR